MDCPAGGAGTGSHRDQVSEGGVQQGFRLLYRGDEPNLRHLPEGRYQRKQTLANAERFITPELKEKERQVLEAEDRAIALEYQLFTEVREAIAKQIPRLQALAMEVARLDVLHAFATVSLDRE